MAVLHHLPAVITKVVSLKAQPVLQQDLFQFTRIGLRAPSHDPHDIASGLQQRLAAEDKSLEIDFAHNRLAVGEA